MRTPRPVLESRFSRLLRARAKDLMHLPLDVQLKRAYDRFRCGSLAERRLNETVVAQLMAVIGLWVFVEFPEIRLSV